MRSYRDKDYVLTKEDFFFCVVGPIHPTDRIIAYLKYIPNSEGKWGRHRKYSRVLSDYTMSSLINTFRLLEDYPYFLFRSPVFNIEMSAVPLNSIMIHFKPEEKIHQLLKAKDIDPLQRKTLKLLEILSRESKVSIENFGITGSILLDIHQEFSDIDLLVYGKENSLLARDALLQLYEKSNFNIHRFDKETHDSWCERKIRQYEISLREAEELYKRKWGIGVFEDKRFSINPVKLETEVFEKYGDRIYFPEGMIKLEATVSDDSDAIFLPLTYRLENVRLINGFVRKEIREVTCYDGFYSDIAREGERIIIYGKLEKIHDKILGIDYYRVLVGSPEAEGKDYIKLVSN